MAVSVIAYLVSRRDLTIYQRRVRFGIFADDKKRSLYIVFSEYIKYFRRKVRIRTIVKCQCNAPAPRLPVRKDAAFTFGVCRKRKNNKG